MSTSGTWERWYPAQRDFKNTALVTREVLADRHMEPKWYWVEDFELDIWITPRAIFWPAWFVWRKMRLERLVFGACRLLRRLGLAEKPEGARWTMQGAWRWPF